MSPGARRVRSVERSLCVVLCDFEGTLVACMWHECREIPFVLLRLRHARVHARMESTMGGELKGDTWRVRDYVAT